MQHDYEYVPVVKTTTYNLLALKHLSADVKMKISPLIMCRGNGWKDIDAFLEEWGEGCIWVDSSRYENDISTIICTELNDPTNHFSKKMDEFLRMQKIHNKLYPVVGFKKIDPIRDVVQFLKKCLSNFDRVGYRLEVSADISLDISMMQSVLASVDDIDLPKITVFVDFCKIETLSNISSTDLDKIRIFLKGLAIKHVVTLSTSYPVSRPLVGQSINQPCLDPYWQNNFKQTLASSGVRSLYGDYAATDPTTETIEFVPGMKPIPYVTYLLDYLEWYTARDGRGGENEKFRVLAAQIIGQSGYHGANFCWANTMIESIANGSRNKAGQMAFWNEIKINQHISAIVHMINNGSFGSIGLGSEDDLEED